MYLLDTNVVSELRKPKPHGGVLADDAGAAAAGAASCACAVGAASCADAADASASASSETFDEMRKMV